MSSIANSDFEVIEDSTPSEKRKRKRKSAATGILPNALNCLSLSLVLTLFVYSYVESVEGFSVFKDSKLTVAASVNEENHPSENDPSEERKEFHRKLEVLITSFVLPLFLFVKFGFNLCTTWSLSIVHSIFLR